MSWPAFGAECETKKRREESGSRRVSHRCPTQEVIATALLKRYTAECIMNYHLITSCGCFILYSPTAACLNARSPLLCSITKH